VLSRLHQQIQLINIIVSVLCYSNWLLSTLVLQVLVDVLSVLMERTELLTLEICCMLIPLLNGLLTSDQDRYLISADFQNFVAVYMAVNAELPCVTSSSG
jgi:predicted branched-subunit amino acid permease